MPKNLTKRKGFFFAPFDLIYNSLVDYLITGES